MPDLGNIPSPGESVADAAARMTPTWYRWLKSIIGALADKQPLDADLTTIADNATADRLWGTTTAGATTLVTGISVSAGAFSGQISFPATQSASAGANVLDDYEEGTFTPTITAASGTFTTVSGSITYIKIGRLVSLIEVSIIITTNGTAAGSVQSTLPFQPDATSIIVGREVAAMGSILQGSITNASPQLQSISDDDNAYPGGSGRALILSGCYRTAS
jgi:hypothetical protein